MALWSLELHVNVTTHRVIRVSAITIAIAILIVSSVALNLYHAQTSYNPSVFVL